MLSSKKKIALVYDAIFPFVKGGAEKRFYEIGKRLAAKGYDVHLYGMKSWDGKKIMQFEGMTLHGICPNLPLYTKSGRRSMWQAVIFGISCLKLFREKFDVLDCCGFPYFSMFTCRFVTWIQRKKLYATWHEVWGKEYWKEYLGELGIIGYWVEKITIRLPDRIISVSNNTTRSIESVLGRTNSLNTITNGVDIEEIKNISPADWTSDVIFVGRLINHKHADHLVEAIARVKRTIPDIRCNIIGSGPERKTISRLISKLGLKENIQMIERVERHEDLYGLMKASKMLVLPSVREGFGLTVIEANAAGIPVITTSHKSNAAKDLIQEGVNGLLSEPNERALAEKILLVLRTGDSFEPKKNIDQYDWNVVVEKVERTLVLGR